MQYKLMDEFQIVRDVLGSVLREEMDCLVIHMTTLVNILQINVSYMFMELDCTLTVMGIDVGWVLSCSAVWHTYLFIHSEDANMTLGSSRSITYSYQSCLSW